MREDLRIARNREKLAELYPTFREQVSAVLHLLEQTGFRPRIQCAWRSEEDQLLAFKTGKSKLKWGFHNATSLKGFPEALAVDIINDDSPLNPSTSFCLALAWAAQASNPALTTGVTWGLPYRLKNALNDAIKNHLPWDGKIGWDPCHLEITELTPNQAKMGARPNGLR